MIPPEEARMLVAVLLQVVAAVGLILGAWLLSGVGGAVMAAAVVVFLVGWSLEQRHSA
jgi:positive regulator of sigma E activity